MCLLQPHYMTTHTLIFLAFLTDLAKTEEVWQGRPINHAVLWPCVILGLCPGLCVLGYCCHLVDKYCCGGTDEESGVGQDSVPRSEYLAMQRRVEKLEQEVHSKNRKEEV